MKFGAFLWQRRGEDLAANARLAEQLGFESVWMGEHLGFPIQFKSTYPYDESGMPPVRNDAAIHDPLIVFAYLAAVTTTIKFGTGVYILPLRNPFAVAKAVAIGSENDIERIINYRRCVVNIGADKTGGNFKLVAE